MKVQLLLGTLLVLVIGLIPDWALGQCGASLSSCKTCHEVNREYPVVTNGDWHQDHSFGDFCEFCHGGNTTVMNEQEAHQSMSLIPVEQPGNACSSCHPSDYQERAETYAAILDIDISSLEPAGNQSASAEPSPADQGGETTESTKTPTTVQAAASTVSVPSGGEVIDFNELLTMGSKENNTNIGNLVLLGMIGGLGLVFFGMFYSFNQTSIRENIRKFGKIFKQPTTSETDSDLPADIAQILDKQPALRRLLIQLQDKDPVVIESLISITNQNGESEKLIKTLAKLDLSLLKNLQQLNEREIDVLLTLAKKM